MIPAEVVLQLIDATMASPRWLLTAEGQMYLHRHPQGR